MGSYIDFSKYSNYVRLAEHCIGLDNKRPYIRGGKAFYRPYRNYFNTYDEADDMSYWVIMKAAGYAMSVDYTEIVRFRLTSSGLYWLGSTLGVRLWDEEAQSWANG